MAERVVKVRLTAQIAEYATAMEEAARKTRAVGTETERAAQKREAFQALGTAATVVGGAMTALSLVVAKTGIEYNTLQQTSRAALSTLLGGAAAANAQMDKLDAFARTSPFSKQTFITAQQQMLAFGIEAKNVVPYLDAIQDAVAAAGGSNQQLGEVAFVLSQISAAGKITATDLMQLGQRGINAAELIGSQMGVTGAEIENQITAGTLGADEALEALTAGMKEKFGGAAANVKDTFGGAMDRVQAAWRDLSSDLMKPLVDPNGGGALVDLINWGADVLRTFQALPEPVKMAGGALFALVGVTALVSGALIFARLKWIDFKIAMEAAGITGTSVRGKLGGLASFLGGPWGIAMMAATAVAMTLNKVIQDGVPAQEKLSNALMTSKTAAEGLSAAFERGSVETFLQGDYADQLDDLAGLLDHAIEAQSNWGVALATSNNQLGAYDSLSRYGVALAQLAQDDLPLAVDKFSELVESQKLTEAQAVQLINEMPAFRDHLVGLATDAGLAADETTLLEIATGRNAKVVGSAADEYMGARREVQGLRDEMTTLMDAINAANGVGQDAVRTNARWQSALAGISEEVQRQKDAYEEAHGTLDGFSLSLDEATAAGSANAASLTDVAAAAQAAAEAQFVQDQATMSAEDAASKYIETLTAQRQEFVDNAVQAGYSADEVQKLADKVFALPSEKEVRIIAEAAEAQREIDNFVNRNNGKTVNIWLNPQVQAANDALASYMSNIPGQATGGPVVGPGPKGVDSELRWLAPGEHVITAREVDAAGGHSGVAQWRSSLLAGAASRPQPSVGVWMQAGQHLGVLGGGQQSAPVQVSLAGAEFTLLVDGNPVRAIVQEQIVSADRESGRVIDRGRRG